MTYSTVSPWRFFALVFALSVPWWLLARFVQHGGLPDDLPLTDAGATFMPMAAAILLVAQRDGRAGVSALLGRVFDYRRIADRRWLLIAIMLMPLLYGAAYGIMHVAGMAVPDAWQPSPSLFLVFAAFFIAAAGEEYGYTAYATDCLQKRYSSLTSALIIGVPWAIWHLPSMIQLEQPPLLIAWGLGVTVAYRVIYVWLYNGSGRSLFVVTLFHAIANTGRTAFPGGRSAFELSNAAVGYGLIIAFAVLVAFAGRTGSRLR